MLFSSIPFLYYFLPAVLLLYFLVPRGLKNTVLLISSLFFYAWGEPIYVFLMVGTICLFYFCGIAFIGCQNIVINGKFRFHINTLSVYTTIYSVASTSASQTFTMA